MTNRFYFHPTANLAFLIGMISLAPGVASAEEPRCSVLKGTYTFTFKGTSVFPGSTTPAPFNGVGFSTFDGAGKWTGIESANFGGFIVRSEAFSGTYTLKPDCTGTMLTVYPNGVVGTLDFVVTNGGKKMYGIGVDDSGQLSVSYTRMH